MLNIQPAASVAILEREVFVSVLRIDSSIQGPRSASSELADLVVAELDGVEVTTRHLVEDPFPADAWATAATAGYVPEADRSEAQTAALALAASVTAELQSADAVVLALPLYNWGVSQHVKTWIDLTLAGAPSPSARLLDGVPVILLTTRGGGYAPGTPRAGWDHNTDFLRRILADVWGADLTVIERELTLAEGNPAMEPFLELAREQHADARKASSAAGRALAVQLVRSEREAA